MFDTELKTESMTTPAIPNAVSASWILARSSRLPAGVAYCHGQGGGRWPEWEMRLLRSLRRAPRPYLMSAGVLYAREIIKGRWLELERFLFMPTNFEYLVAYMRRDIVGTRWKEMEDAILNGTCDPLIRSSLAVRYATQVLGGRWRRAEPILIQDSAHHVLSQLFDGWMAPSAFTCAVEYAVNVMGGRWRRLEREVVSGRSTLFVGVDYAERIRKSPWRGLERQLKASAPSALKPICIANYACFVRRKRWPAGEKSLLSHPQTTNLLEAIIIYAFGVVGRRWRKAEPLLANSPRHLSEYADKVLKSRLPSPLHNSMVLRSFDTPDDAHIREYIEKYGR